MDSRLKEEFLTCIICHEVFRDPVTLHCGHTICSQCVSAFTKTQREAIGEDLCTPCKEDGDNTEAQVWCSDCKKALCAECQKVHRKLMSTHLVTDLRNKKLQSSESVEETFACVNHRDSVVDMMCQTCDIAVCPRCCIESHKGCIDTVVKLVDALPKINKALENSEEDLQHNIESLENEIPVLQSQVEILEESCHQAEADIDTFSRNISAALKEDLQGLKKQALNDLHEDIDKTTVRLQIAQQNKGLVKEVLKSKSDMARYEVYKTCQRSAETDKVQIHTSRVVKLQLQQQQQQKTESKDLKKVGHITQIFEQRKSIWQKTKACLVDTISAAADTDKTTPKLYDLIVLEINNTTAVVVSDLGNLSVKCIYRVDEREQRCKSQIKFTGSPRSLTKIASTEISVVIPDLKQIITFSVTPDLIKGTSINTYKPYHGICFLPVSQFAALALLTGDVDIIDMSGVILRSLCPGTFVNPGRVVPGNRNVLFVTDINKNEIRAITDGGEPIFVLKEKISHPRGLACSLSRDYFAVDCDSSKVIHFSECGEFVKDVLTTKDGLQKPTGLYVDKNNKMYVASETGCIFTFIFV